MCSASNSDVRLSRICCSARDDSGEDCDEPAGGRNEETWKKSVRNVSTRHDSGGSASPASEDESDAEVEDWEEGSGGGGGSCDEEAVVGLSSGG